MRAIFLDIDGVLTTSKTFWKTFDPTCTIVLESILKAVPDARIIITSTWRRGQTVRKMQTIMKRGKFRRSVKNLGLQDDLHKRVIGMTECLDGTRGDEIFLWLYNNKDEFKEYVVIDDDTDISPHENHFVQTEPNKGLQPEHIEKVLKILKV